VNSTRKEMHFFFKPKKLCQLISEEQSIWRLQLANDFFKGKFQLSQWYSLMSHVSVKPAIKNGLVNSWIISRTHFPRKGEIISQN
jgi:hypothetical protein